MFAQHGNDSRGRLSDQGEQGAGYVHTQKKQQQKTGQILYRLCQSNSTSQGPPNMTEKASVCTQGQSSSMAPDAEMNEEMINHPSAKKKK